MNTAIIHYHLNRGGVAQVVINHLRSLDAVSDEQIPTKILLMHGGQRQGWPDDLADTLARFELVEVVFPELEYEEGSSIVPRPIALAEIINSALSRHGCHAEDTLLHVHNHALGKNMSLPGALWKLAQLGYSLLLQIHDFAEDFRPANYRRLQEGLSPGDPSRVAEKLYPQAPQIHYAVLNGRDFAILRDAGIDLRRLHLLPNPVPEPKELAVRSCARTRMMERLAIPNDFRYVLYPVRGIRRKNLGEALLWAAAAGSKTAFGMTLPPMNPIEQPSYERWTSLASELRLPCLFGVGDGGGLSLAENLAACDRVLTTSVAEGFGMVFLETCLAQRSLIGRDLPEITRDFVEQGMTFEGLQARIDIPAEWINRNDLIDSFTSSYNATLDAYGREPLSRQRIEQAIMPKIQDQCLDFGDLDAALQESVLRRVSVDSNSREMLVTKNPWLYSSIDLYDSRASTRSEENAAIIRQHYSLEVSGRRLAQVYQGVINSTRESLLEAFAFGERILEQFLSLNRFRPVRL